MELDGYYFDDLGRGWFRLYVCRHGRWIAWAGGPFDYCMKILVDYLGG
jgi:hypothetical protein